MVRAVVRKEGDKVVFEVSTNDPQVEGLKDGQVLNLTIGAAERKHISDADFDVMVDRLIDENQEALEYLAQ